MLGTGVVIRRTPRRGRSRAVSSVGAVVIVVVAGIASGAEFAREADETSGRAAATALFGRRGCQLGFRGGEFHGDGGAGSLLLFLWLDFRSFRDFVGLGFFFCITVVLGRR